jgi:phosphoribosylanthranilate isomerase
MTLVKICGITNLPDAQSAVAAGADLLGFNFYERSPRYISPVAAREIIDQLPNHVLSVGVFVNESLTTIRSIASTAKIDKLQLHGDESPSYCNELDDHKIIKAFRVGNMFDPQQTLEFAVESIMLDASHPELRGGTGIVFDWSVAVRVRELGGQLFLAGGLGSENVAAAIKTVRPFAVDACSALEVQPGKKDSRKVAEFVAAVRNVKP